MLVMAAACSPTSGIWGKSAGPASAGPADPRLVLLHVVLRHVVLLVHHAAAVGHLAAGHCVSLLVHFAVRLRVLRHAGLAHGIFSEGRRRKRETGRDSGSYNQTL